jgi:hypothetical protein
MGARQKQLAGNHVLANQTHVIPRWHRFENFDGIVIQLLYEPALSAQKIG